MYYSVNYSDIMKLIQFLRKQYFIFEVAHCGKYIGYSECVFVTSGSLQDEIRVWTEEIMMQPGGK